MARPYELYFSTKEMSDKLGRGHGPRLVVVNHMNVIYPTSSLVRTPTSSAPVHLTLPSVPAKLDEFSIATTEMKEETGEWFLNSACDLNYSSWNMNLTLIHDRGKAWKKS